MTKNITISEAEYDQLREDQYWLECLRNAGVDNWEGWDFALEEFNENKE